MAKVIIREGEHKGREEELHHGSNTIGRDLGNTIVLESPGVSRHHATIRWEPPICRIIDHGSTNGTYVNGEKVVTHSLKTGDIIRTGPVEWFVDLTDTRTKPVTSAENFEATVLDIVGPDEVSDLHDQARRGRPIRSDRDLATLYRTVDCMMANPTPLPLLQSVSEVMVQAFSATGAAAFLISPLTRNLELAAGTTDPPNSVLPVSKTIISRCIQTGETLLVRDAEAEGFSSQSGSVGALKIHSALAAPLNHQGRPLGAIHLSRSREQRPFNEKDLKLFSVICELVAMALVNSLRREELEVENVALGEIIKGRFAMFGNSPAIRRVFTTIEQAGASNLCVLIQGETGSGKELVARAIHSRSNRRTNPFISINLAAIPDYEIEAKLFGKDQGEAGAIEDAHRGTLYLEEISILPLPLQEKLCHVIEKESFYRVGGHHAQKVDLRLVVATTRDLEVLVRQGLFRQDLYYRLQVVTIHLPPLRERKEDIPLLAEQFLSTFQESSSHSPKRLSPDAIEKLVSHAWPGNVRELRNAVIRAALTSHKPELDASDFNFLVPSDETMLKSSRPLSLEEMEIRHILEVLEFCQWRREKAAEILGVDRKTLFNKIHRYKLEKLIRGQDA